MKTELESYLVNRRFLAAFLILLLAGQSFAQTAAALSATEKTIADSITVATIREVTAALSADDMQGRGTMQPGGDKAANWIADRFKSLGLKPLGDKGSYLQKIDFKEVVATPETSFKVGEESLVRGADFGFDSQLGAKEVSGDLVFISYGIQASAIKRDDLAGIDLMGKVVVMLEGPPAGFPKKSWDEQKAARSIFFNVAGKGPAAILYIGHGREEHPPEMNIDYMSRRQIVLPAEERDYSIYPMMGYVSRAGAEKLFAKSATSLKDALAQSETVGFKPIKLNQKAKLVAKYKITKGASSNVAGYIEGSDPKLKEEAVLFTAHYDAYGVDNGKIYHGAADNALGVGEMMATAEAFSKMAVKPKRSMVFLAVTGEEYGLFGSKYWAKNPTWNIKKVAADLNLDGIGSEVYGPVKTIVGFGAEHSTLGAMLDQVAKIMDITVIPDPMPEEKAFYRSDHYSFVERGVPALMLLGAPGGDKEIWMKRIKDWENTGDYHQPSDTIKPDWAWEGPEAVADLMGILGWRISELDTMPAWLPSSRFSKYERGNTKEVPEEN
jgi:hypothetical protein